ncbi:MAG: hypothetical protein H6622_10915 [Halobacteriovoraceae bacterium]|nr:hypothetical protein [Halobacteriovoraceae bacterium]
MFKNFFCVICFILTSSAFSYGLGISNYPMLVDKKMISAEATGIFSSGGGMGFQGRFTQKVSQKIVADAGMGISGGDRVARLFIGADYEVIPDYMKQPKVSIKLNYEFTKEFRATQNSFSLTPIVSKGFSFWGKEAYPFLSLPVGIGLNDTYKTYDTFVAAGAGISGKIPFENYEHLTASLETTINLRNSVTAVFLGVNFPLN